MTIGKPIEVVKKSIEVMLPKKYLTELREQAANGMKDYTDKQILEALAEDILERYFNTEYFDVEALVDALS